MYKEIYDINIGGLSYRFINFKKAGLRSVVCFKKMAKFRINRVCDVFWIVSSADNSKNIDYGSTNSILTANLNIERVIRERMNEQRIPKELNNWEYFSHENNECLPDKFQWVKSIKFWTYEDPTNNLGATISSDSRLDPDKHVYWSVSDLLKRSRLFDENGQEITHKSGQTASLNEAYQIVSEIIEEMKDASRV